MDSLKINKVQLRNLQIEDYEQLAQSFTRYIRMAAMCFGHTNKLKNSSEFSPKDRL